MAASEWRISTNIVAGKKLYQVYRLKDKDAVDHSGNRETRGGLYEEEWCAERLAAALNEETDNEER